MIATLTDCIVYGVTIVKTFVLGEFPKTAPIQKMHIVLEYDTDTRQCKIFLASKNTVEEEPELIKLLNNDDSYDYDVVMDRHILGDYIGRVPKMVLETEDYNAELHEDPSYDTDDDY